MNTLRLRFTQWKEKSEHCRVVRLLAVPHEIQLREQRLINISPFVVLCVTGGLHQMHFIMQEVWIARAVFKNSRSQNKNQFGPLKLGLTRNKLRIILLIIKKRPYTDYLFYQRSKKLLWQFPIAKNQHWTAGRFYSMRTLEASRHKTNFKNNSF